MVYDLRSDALEEQQEAEHPLIADMREAEHASETALVWLERTLPTIMRRLLDADDLDLPLLQLPLAQMRLAQALYAEREEHGSTATDAGETMSRLSERLGVRHNALTQVADRLVARGLIERVADVCDRRVVRLRLTETGYDWVHVRRQRRRAHLESLWVLLSVQERQEVLASVRILEQAAARLQQNSSSSSSSMEGTSVPLTMSQAAIGSVV